MTNFAVKKKFYILSPGGDVRSLTLCGELFQVLQSDFFVSRAVCQAVIDHRVLKRHKQSAHPDRTKIKKKHPGLG